MSPKKLHTMSLGLSLLLLGSLALLWAMPRVTPLPSNIPMTATFRDNLTDPPDRILSDGGGMYIDNVDEVDCVLDGSGDFALDTVTSKTVIRHFFLDFRAPASPETSPPFASSLEEGYMNTFHGANLPGIPVGTAIRTNFQVHFTAAGSGWFIRFQPNQYPDTSNVLVRRTAEDTWEIEAAPTDIAKLLSYPTKGRFVLTDHGNFFMPFKIVARKK